MQPLSWALCSIRIHMSSKVEIRTLEELKNMHTGTLMSRRKALLKCEEAFEVSDSYNYENKSIPNNTGFIEFKDSPEWEKAYKELKSVLSTRENIPNKKERKEIRKNKARSTK